MLVTRRPPWLPVPSIPAVLGPPTAASPALRSAHSHGRPRLPVPLRCHEACTLQGEVQSSVPSLSTWINMNLGEFPQLQCKQSGQGP